MKLIEIIVAPNGQTRVETKGFQGGECREASRLLEQALGRQTSEQPTAEYFVTEVPLDADLRASH